jgi:hypothetical protein
MGAETEVVGTGDRAVGFGKAEDVAVDVGNFDSSEFAAEIYHGRVELAVGSGVLAELVPLVV